MRHNTYNTYRSKSEQLDWQGQLSRAVDERVDELTRSGFGLNTGWKSEHGLLAPDRTRMRLAVLPTLSRPQLYVTGRTTIRDFGEAGSFPLLDMTKISSSDGALRLVSACRDDVPLDFMIDTLPPFDATSINAVSSSGVAERLHQADAHYQAFSEPDGTHVYKFGEDHQLHPVDPIEGGHLLWQVSNSKPAT